MNASVTSASGLAGPVQSIIRWLAVAAQIAAPPLLRIALAVPFFRSGLTKWDGFLSLSPSAAFLFEEEFKLHILGQAYSFPFPDTLAFVDRRRRDHASHAPRRRACNAVQRARSARHDRRHPARRARRLGELSSSMGVDRDCNHRARAGKSVARPSHCAQVVPPRSVASVSEGRAALRRATPRHLGIVDKRSVSWKGRAAWLRIAWAPAPRVCRRAPRSPSGTSKTLASRRL